ncbi:MAG: UDP-glucose 4-epimerase GalE [Rhizomicrobium sp.]
MNTRPDTCVVLVSGGAGYIGSHVSHVLKHAGFTPVVVDSLVNGNLWATRGASAFRKGDIGDADFIRAVCDEVRPMAAIHFAAFIEVGESVKKPEKYFTNNRDKAKVFFDTLAERGVRNIVFSSTAAVYGAVTDCAPIPETCPTRPINPYGQSKLEAETHLRTIENVKSVALRYFNVAGAEPSAGLGEAHFPESHLIPRIVLPLIDAPKGVQEALGLAKGFKIYGTDYPTRDGTAVRDYIHVMDLADAHVRALRYLLAGGATDIFNLGSGSGFSVREIVDAARRTLDRPDFNPGTEARREGDPATLIADGAKTKKVLGWAPERGVDSMIGSAATWHRSQTYAQTIIERANVTSG